MLGLPQGLVDAHHHLWNPVSGDPDIGYRWLRDVGAPKPFGDPTAIQRDYLLDEFLDEPEPLSFAASVHLQADGAIPDPVAETRFVQSLSEKAGFPIAIVGFVDLARDDAEEVIQRHQQYSRFRGVRQILSRLEDRPGLSFAPEHYLRNDLWRRNFTLLAERGLSFDLQLYPEQMAEAADFLAAHPKVPVIIDHAGSPYDQSPDGIARWREGLALLAALPATAIKLCGFGMFDPAWTAETIKPLVETVDALFGTERILFASNFPVDKLMRPYGDLLRDLALLYADAPQETRDAIFRDNARRIYRL